MLLTSIELHTSQLAETEHFYAQILGLSILDKSPKAISFSAGQSRLIFIQSDKGQPKYHFAFNIPRNQLNEALAWISAKVDMIPNPEATFVSNFENWNAKALYFYDNNGNILEFIARFDLENDRQGDFDSGSILSVSEIGIVTDIPLLFAENLVETRHLSYFSKGPRLENFITVGDDNGLLIIVQTNRKWYPTELPAKQYYTKVEILDGGVSRVLTVNPVGNESAG